jgi:hypothetical protein
VKNTLDKAFGSDEDSAIESTTRTRNTNVEQLLPTIIGAVAALFAIVIIGATLLSALD